MKKNEITDYKEQIEKDREEQREEHVSKCGHCKNQCCKEKEKEN